MTNWISHPTFLSGQDIDLVPLELNHFEEMNALAKDNRIWTHYVFDGTDSEQFRKKFEQSLTERENGTAYPFGIFHKAQKKFVGSTRLMDIQPQHRKLEIGTTWLHPDYWGTKINAECKLLLLIFCFEVLQAYRVQLKTDENNLRSRKAIEKIGGTFEGVFRNDMVREDGTKRNSIYYSFIDTEWKNKKTQLLWISKPV